MLYIGDITIVDVVHDLIRLDLLDTYSHTYVTIALTLTSQIKITI